MTVQAEIQGSSDAVVSTSSQVVIPPDELQGIVQLIEAIPDENTALERKRALVLDQVLNYFALGGLLKRMSEKKWYCGHETFKELCEQEFDLHQRQAYYFIRIFEKTVEANLTWADIKDVGWTKLRLLCGKVEPETLSEWVEKAKVMPLSGLETAVKGLAEANPAQSQKRKIVAFNPDQWETIQLAVERVREETELDKPICDAIRLIATEYVSASPEAAAATSSPDGKTAVSTTDPNYDAVSEETCPVAETSVVTWLKNVGICKAVAVFRMAFPNHHLDAMPSFLKK